METSQRFFAILIMFCMITLVSGCYSFQRSPESGYSSGSSKSSLSGWKRASQETTYKAQSAENSSSSADIKIRLKQLENSMQGRRELEQYSKALPWFTNDDEKIEFLSTGAFEERQKWLQANKFYERQKKVTTHMQELLDAQDIAVGMPEILVKKAWGEPLHIDVSGIPQFHNQRWVYSKTVTSQEGFKTEKKIVYFEGGKVVGWEVE